jgi:hypothetical protein
VAGRDFDFTRGAGWNHDLHINHSFNHIMAAEIWVTHSDDGRNGVATNVVCSLYSNDSHQRHPAADDFTNVMLRPGDRNNSWNPVVSSKTAAAIAQRQLH